ncbi:hypothetical protein HK099_003027 [Clydaea vesicula]|uniref:Phosphatidylinositol diacylglycerol-lyase n=1 Tax=Clydaea vesicula TaxID=447962 RepID=A0AAD5TSI8_9FUNG|nr:hypothetical protein HK099_003027 [Clydaea vesicula]
MKLIYNFLVSISFLTVLTLQRSIQPEKIDTVATSRLQESTLSKFTLEDMRHFDSLNIAATENNADWMANLKDVINDRKIFQIDLPGAHHGGFVSVPWYLAIPGVWAKCQNQGLTSNLNAGIRYFDLRIGEYDHEIFFTHTIRSNEKLFPGLIEIKNWLNNHPGEILIFEIAVDGG